MKRRVETWEFECTYCPEKTTITILEGDMRGFTVPRDWVAESVCHRVGETNQSTVTHICPKCQARRKDDRLKS